MLFELLVKPFLCGMMGHAHVAASLPLALAESVKRKRAERDAWLPVVLTEAGTVRPVAYHGSAHVHALYGADGMICMPVGVRDLAEGTVVNVRPL